MSDVKPGETLSQAGDSVHGSELAGALHEVSNALTVVLGWLDHARTQLPSGATRDALEVAYLHARLGHTVARRAIGARVDDDASSRSALAIARDAALGVRQEASRRHVYIEIDDRDAPDLLLTTSAVALQILVNLLLNAVAFSPIGGKVVLSVRGNSGEMTFGVTDSGPGIPSEDVERIFVAAASTRDGGAGIGLRHSYALALQHEGELRLVATGPTGSRFELKWPVGEAPSGLFRSVPPRALDGMRILVLEDDPAVMALIEFGLSGRGASVVCVSSQTELFGVLQNGIFDVALLDLSPLGTDPTQSLHRLRAANATLPVIVISGSVAPDVESAAIVGWVRKPFEISEIVDALTRACMTE